MSKIVERTLDLLELFATERRPLSLSDVARLLNIPVSSCHDVLQAMQARGYLYELAPRAGYYPTLRLQQLGKEISDNDPVVLRAELVLRGLRDTLDETVLLAKVTGSHASYLLTFEPTHPLRFMVKLGDDVRGLHTTSGGKAILGALDERAFATYLKGAVLKPQTSRTITDKTMLREDIDRSRERGWYLNQGESLEEVTTVSAPFRWNAAVYIVTVAGPSARVDHRLEQAASLLVDVCRQLEMRPPDLKRTAVATQVRRDEPVS
jgi:DNA-binding IclR family transcriptional regulator